MAILSSILAQEVPWTEEPGKMVLGAAEESDMAQPLNNNNNMLNISFCLRRLDQQSLRLFQILCRPSNKRVAYLLGVLKAADHFFPSAITSSQIWAFNHGNEMLLLSSERHQDSLPPEERNSIWASDKTLLRTFV